MALKKISVILSYILIAFLFASIGILSSGRDYKERLRESQEALASARANERGAILLADSLSERSRLLEQKLTESARRTEELSKLLATSAERSRLLEASIRDSIGSSGTIDARLREAETKLERNRILITDLKKELSFNGEGSE